MALDQHCWPVLPHLLNPLVPDQRLLEAALSENFIQHDPYVVAKNRCHWAKDHSGHALLFGEKEIVGDC